MKRRVTTTRLFNIKITQLYPTIRIRLCMVRCKEFWAYAQSFAALARIIGILTLTTRKSGEHIALRFLVRRKEFESLAFGSVDQRSIQLS